jgi:DNA-binding response OmpR family regulator
MKVLIVDDDRVLADIVAYTFRREGFEISLAFDGVSALERWAEEKPDLLVLDVNMPELDGFSVCRQIRKQSNVPIIMLTVRGEDDDVVHGLELGADDYIPKPFSPRQLVARAYAVLRRSGQVAPTGLYEVEDLVLDVNHREARLGEGEPVPLSENESRLLEYLMMNVGQIIPVDSIFNHIWGSSGGDQDDLRQLIRRLRTKIEPDPSNPIYIRNLPGRGYGLVAPRKGLDH